MKRLFVCLMLLLLPLVSAADADILVSGQVFSLAEGETAGSELSYCVDKEFSVLELEVDGSAKVMLQGQVSSAIRPGETISLADSRVSYVSFETVPQAELLVNGDVLSVPLGETASAADGTQVSVLTASDSGAKLLVDGEVSQVISIGATSEIGGEEVSVLSIGESAPSAQFLVDGDVTRVFAQGETQEVSVCVSKSVTFLELDANGNAKVMIDGEVSQAIRPGQTIEFAGEEVSYLADSQQEEVKYEDADDSATAALLVDGEVISSVARGQTVTVADGVRLSLVSYEEDEDTARAKVLVGGEVSPIIVRGETIEFAGLRITLLEADDDHEAVEGSDDRAEAGAEVSDDELIDRPEMICDGIMYIRNEQTGECQQTMTSCDLDKQVAPDGWTKVDDCDDTDDQVRPGQTDERTEDSSAEQRSEQESASCDSGCLLEGSCVDIGYRAVVDGTASFCAASGEFVAQLEVDASCQNSFECSTNECSSGACVDLQQQLEEQRGLLERILSWFGGIFG